MAGTGPMLKISINGGPDEEGRLAQQWDGALRSWGGEVYGYHESGDEVSVAVWGPKVLLGRAIITSCEVAHDGTAVSRFAGNGPLRSVTHKQLEEILAALPDER